MYLIAKRCLHSPVYYLIVSTISLNKIHLGWLGNPKSITPAPFPFSLLGLSSEPVRGAPVTTCSRFRAKFRRNKWKEFRQMHRWDKQAPERPGGLCVVFFVVVTVIPFRSVITLSRGGLWGRGTSRRRIVTGLVDRGFMCPFHFHSACPCERHLICCPANVPCGRHTGRSPASACVSVSPRRFVGTFSGYCEFNSPEGSHGSFWDM